MYHMANIVHQTSGTYKGIPLSQLPHDNYGPQLNVAIWLLTSLSGLFLALRVYCKFLRHRGLWWDDHVLILSWVALSLSVALQCYCVSLGFGKHPWDVNLKNLLPFFFYSNLAGFVSILAALWSKTSFAITLLRVSDGWIKRFVWFVIISVNIALGLSALFQFIHCTPVAGVWDPNIKRVCWPASVTRNINMFTSAYSGAMDIALALLPWKIIWPLAMNKKEKVGVLVAMSMGVFAGLTSIAKCYTLESSIGNSDIISLVNLVVLATAESAITIMAASLPILRALLRDVRRIPPPAVFYHEYDDSEWAKSLPTKGQGKTIVTSTKPRDSFLMQEISQPQPVRRHSRISYRLSNMFFSSATGDKGFTTLSGEHRSEPPSGRIVQTDEVRIEYHIREIQKIGRDLGPV